jgi:hypothetical protein
MPHRHRLAPIVLFAAQLALAPPLSAELIQPRGDGRDDTAVIQAAIDAGRGNLEFARGVYRLTKTVTIDLDRVGWTSLSGGGVAQFRMEAAGPAFRFVGTHGGTASPKTVRDEVWERQRTPMVDGIEILGANPEACGIEADGTMQLTLTRVVVRKAKHAVHLVNRNRNVTLSECHLYENTGIGVFMDRLNLHQINIANCHISYNSGGGVVARDSEIRNLQIGSCDIEGNMGDQDSQPTANVWLDSTGTSVGEVAIVGCTIQHTHDAPDSANIRISGWSKERPFTDERRTGNVTIADNVLSDVAVNIDLYGVRGITISGNTMWKGYAANVIAENCTEMVFSGNLYDRNPRYHYGDGGKAKLGVQLKDCNNVTINGEHYGGDVVGHPAVLQVSACDGVNISGCSFARVSAVGILFDDVPFGQVSGCLFTGTTPQAVPVKMAGESDVQQHNNRARSITVSEPNPR